MSGESKDKVIDIASGRPVRGGNGDGGDFGERLARIEELAKHLAKTADLERLRGELSAIKWILGLVAIPLISATVKYLFSL